MPYTLTVTFSGLQDPTHSEYCSIPFSPCYARCPGGISTRCMGPGGSYEVTGDYGGEPYTYREYIRGPIQSILITDYGSRGYTRIARVPPTITIKATPGSGAEFTPHLKTNDSCGCNTWSLESVSVTGGEGYVNGSPLIITAEKSDIVITAATAKLKTTTNRLEPELFASVSSGPGSGAQFEITLTEPVGTPPAWGIASISVTGGDGYENNTPLTITAAENVTTVHQAIASIRVGRGAPSQPESWQQPNAVISVTLAQSDPPPDATYEITGVSLSGDISPVPDQATLGISFADGETIEGAYIVMIVAGTPSIALASVSTWNPEASGASVEPQVSLVYDEDSVRYWEVSSVSGSGGTGYSLGDLFTWSIDNYYTLSAWVTEIDENGAIISLDIYQSPGWFTKAGVPSSFNLIYGGKYVKYNGVPESVSISNAGSYYVAVDDGIPTGVEVTEGGEYYREDRTKNHCPTTFTYIKDFCGGIGAELKPIVDVDINSPTVGSVTGIQIVNGGDNYHCWDWIENKCNASRNGKAFVLKAQNPKELLSVHAETSCSDACSSSDISQPHIKILPTAKRFKPGVRLWAEGREGTLTAELGSGTDENGLEYWYISSVTATGGYAYKDGDEIQFSFYYEDRPYVYPYYVLPGGTGIVRQISPSATLHATPYTPSAPDWPGSSDAKYCCPRAPGGKPGEGGELTGATINNPGKFWMSREYDGQPTSLHELQVISAGGGFARYARVAPVLNISGVSGATFTPTFEKVNDDSECGRDYWTVESISVSGGQNGVDNQPLSIYPKTENDVIQEPVVAHVLIRRDEPVLNIAVVGRKNRGSGGSLTVTLEKIVKEEGERDSWKIATVEIANEGSNYLPDVVTGGGAYVTIEPSDINKDKIVSQATIALSVNLSGKLSDAIIVSPGDFYRHSGVPDKVVVTREGKSYRLDKSASPIVDDVTLVIDQSPPSDGSGAEIVATVDSVNNSPTFGQLKNVHFSSHGSGYTIFGGGTFYRGGCSVATTLNAPPVTLQLLGKNKPIEVKIGHETFRTENGLVDCENLPTPAIAFHSTAGGSASISRGGEWDSRLADCRGACGEGGGENRCDNFCTCCHEQFLVKVDGQKTKEDLGWMGCRWATSEPNTGYYLHPGAVIVAPGVIQGIEKRVRSAFCSHVEGDVTWENEVAYYCTADSSSKTGFKWVVSSAQIVRGCPLQNIQDPLAKQIASNYWLVRHWRNFIMPDDDGNIPAGPIDKGQLIWRREFGAVAVDPAMAPFVPAFCVPEKDFDLECIHT